MSLSSSAPKKTPGDMFCDLKRRNTEIIVKIVESEVDFRVLHSSDKTNLAMQLI